MDLETEKQIVEKAKYDLQAFGQIYDVYFGKIYSYVAYLVGNNSEAEDIVSETFEKAMLNIDKFEYRGYSFGAWLYRIARNLVYDRAKGKKTVSLDEIEIFIGEEDYNPEKLAGKSEMKNYLAELVKELKPEQKEVIILRYIKGYSIKQVCDITQRSEDSVKSLAKRGLARLRELYEP